MRYFIEPERKAWYDGEVYPITPQSIQIDPTPAQKTGLLDRDGREIWKAPDPIGFRFEGNG